MAYPVVRCPHCCEPILYDHASMGEYVLHAECEAELNTLDHKIEFLAATAGLHISDPEAEMFRNLKFLAVNDEDHDRIVQTVNELIDDSGHNFSDWVVMGRMRSA